MDSVDTAPYTLIGGEAINQCDEKQRENEEQGKGNRQEHIIKGSALSDSTSKVQMCPRLVS